MSDAVWVAIITVVVGGAFTIAVKMIDRKAERASAEVVKNTAQVDTLTTAMEGLQILANQQRAELDRKDTRISFLEKRCDTLATELDLCKGDDK